jgi:FixJ family two-component response regulator
MSALFKPQATTAAGIHAPAAPTVFVVDDDVSFSRSVGRVLRASGLRVETYASAAEFLAELRSDVRGCIVTDLMMPGMNGLALQEAMHNAANPLPVIFLTGHGDIPTTVQAMRGGAEDFLTKDASRDELLAAVNRALRRDEQDGAERARLKALREPFARLTTREVEVLRHVIQGKLNKQIAADLGIHERTVKLHRTSITTKLRVQSVAELTRMVDQARISSIQETGSSDLPG